MGGQGGCERRIEVFVKIKKKKSVTAQLISAFVFAIRIVQSLYYIHLKFQASSHLLWLYRPVCVGPGRKPLRPVFSQRGSIVCRFLGGKYDETSF